MAHEGDEGDGDAHRDEDYRYFRQAAPRENAYLQVRCVLQRSDGDEGDPGRLKDTFNNWKINSVLYIETLNPMNPVLCWGFHACQPVCSCTLRNKRANKNHIGFFGLDPKENLFGS